MKKIILMFVASACGLQVMAQNINPENDYQGSTRAPEMTKGGDSVATGWCIDANLAGGFLMQTLTTSNMAANYLNAVNSNIAGLQYKNGSSFGIDLQAGYFFGCQRHFGIGAGIMYMAQQGDLSMDHFHIEYQSTDNFGNTFRQVLTSDGPVKESVNTSNLSIPVVFKYKTNFSHHVGFTGDAGLLFNVLEQNNYTAKSSFDYEAIYKYSGSEGNITTVYDNSPTPLASDLLITKGQSTNGNAQQYFNTLRNEGYNVGLGVSPNSNKGTVSYATPSVGLIIHPALNIWLCDNWSLNAGVVYIYQDFTNSASSGYQVTNKVGAYSSVMNSVTNAANNLIGIDLGVRYSFTKHRAPAPTETEEMPETPVAPPVEEAPAASPVSEDEMEPEPVNISTPILFDVNKVTIKLESYPVLEEAVKEMEGNKNSLLVIHGYTDITGTAAYNRALSRRRAVAVKNYLHKKGVKSRMMKTVAHGSKNPAASNATREGRAKNRRVVMKLKDIQEQ